MSFASYREIGRRYRTVSVQQSARKAGESSLDNRPIDDACFVRVQKRGAANVQRGVGAAHERWSPNYIRHASIGRRLAMLDNVKRK